MKGGDRNGTKNDRDDNYRSVTNTPHRGRTTPGVRPHRPHISVLFRRKQANHDRRGHSRMGNRPRKNAGRNEDTKLTSHGNY